MDENCARFEHPDWLGTAAVDQRRDLGIRIDVDEPAAELVAVADTDRPGVIFGVLMALGEQLLEHDRDFLPVGSRERIELEGMLPNRQHLVMRLAGDRSVDAGELAAARLFPL